MGVPGSAKNVKLGLDFEATFGAPKVTPTLHYFSFLQSGFKASQGLIFNKSVRADLNPLAPVLDKQDAGMSLTHYPTLETAPFFQKWLLGTLVEAGSTAPVITQGGTPGVTTYTYKIVPKISSTAVGLSATGTTTTGHATLDNTNKNILTWPAVTGATSYDVYRVSGGASQGKVATVSAPTVTYNDEGGVGDAGTATSTHFILTSKLGSTLPPTVVAEGEVSVASTARFLKLLGLTIESLDIEWDVAGFLQFTINAVGQNGSVQTSTLDASPDDWTTADPLNHLQISSLLLGGLATTVIKKGKVSIKFNPYKDDYRAGQGSGRLSLVQDVAEISGTLDIVIDSTTILGDIAAGISGSSIKVIWTESANHYFSLELPKLTVQAALPALGDSPILMVPGATFQAYYDSTAATSIVLETGGAYQATKYA